MNFGGLHRFLFKKETENRVTGKHQLDAVSISFCFLMGCLSALLILSVVLCECEREKAQCIVWSTISQRSSQRDAHRQWHPYSITNQRNDKGLLHYWLRSCSSNKAIHPGDSMTGRYELDGCKRLSNSDIENWNVDRVQTNRNLSQIFSIICCKLNSNISL